MAQLPVDLRECRSTGERGANTKHTVSDVPRGRVSSFHGNELWMKSAGELRSP